MKLFQKKGQRITQPTPESIARLAKGNAPQRSDAAWDIFICGSAVMRGVLERWAADPELRALMVQESIALPGGSSRCLPKLTVGIAVMPKTFEQIRAAHGTPPLANAPSDQDAMEFELEFQNNGLMNVRLDILTSKAPDGDGAIARFLEKFGEGIQQVEIDVTDVDRATEILRARFKLEPIYPAARRGANGTRVNFFLVAASNNQKVLVELVEQPNISW